MRVTAHLFLAIVAVFAAPLCIEGRIFECRAESQTTAVVRFRNSRGFVITSRQASTGSAADMGSAQMGAPTPGAVNAECRIGQPIVIARSIAQQVNSQLAGKFSNIRISVRFGRDLTKTNVAQLSTSGFKLTPGDGPLRYSVAVTGSAPLSAQCVAQIPVFVSVSAKSSTGEQLRETTRSVVPIIGTYE